MGKHRTTWEDGMLAGIECDGEDGGTISAHPDEDPQACGNCGAQLRLVWDVRLEEVAAPITKKAAAL